MSEGSLTCNNDRDPFWKYPIRTSKGGGTKCTTCEKRENCHDCCTCVWEYICVNYNLDCNEIILLNGNPDLKTAQWDCVNHRYDLSIECDGYPIDIYLTYEKFNNECYAVLTSETLDLTGDNRLKILFSDTSHCKCPVWDFSIDYNTSIQIRPYEMVSIGNQRCINKGPDDCTYGRCIPKHLCANVFTAARPNKPFRTRLSWYENDEIEIDGCCNGNKLPTLLIARFTNFSDDCTCIAPKKSDTVYWPAKHMGNLFTDAGSLIHLKHKVASNYDFYVTNYPNVPQGSNVWESYGYFTLGDGPDDLIQLCPNTLCQTETPEEPEGPYTVPWIYGRMIVWHDDIQKKWKIATEIINITDSLNNGNTDYKDKPYYRDNPYSNVHVLDTETLACNPFHIKSNQFNEPSHCYDESGNRTDGNSILQIHVQEFIGWVGENPLNRYKKITFYSEVVVIAGPVQSLPDCTAKLHLQEDELFDSFKSRGDSYQIGREWPGYAYNSRFIFTGLTGTCKNEEIAAIDIFAEPCGGCPEEPIEDPYAPDVRTECCPNRIPKKLTATFVATNNCAAADGDTFEVNYNDNPQNPESKQWYGTYSGTNCSFCILLECANLTGSYVWRFFISYDCINYQLVNATDLVCDPFFFQSQEFSPPACVCLPVGTPNQRAYIIITE